MSKLPPPLCLSPISCIHSLALKTSPLASQQLFACISTWFQCLSFPPCLSTTSCAHLVSISNFPPVPIIKLPKLPAFIGFQYLYFPRSLPTTSCVHFVLISKLPPRCPATTSCIHLASIFPVPPWPPKVPPTCASPQLPAFMRFQYLSFPSSLHSFLHAPSFGFNI